MPTRREMIVDGTTAQVVLTVYAETDYLAVTRVAAAGPLYYITHKPTGLIIGGPYHSIAVARGEMKKIVGLDWNFGQNWSLKYKQGRQRPSGTWKRTRDALEAMGWFKLKQEVEG